ncbi:hypothetical protein OG21DRAFT_121721 [Imleria badia]|nr:hypothetical protein OG21DRAFT_121721 [Imleria badia]
MHGATHFTTLAQKGSTRPRPSTFHILCNDHHTMAWSSIIEYKTRLAVRPDDTRITSHKPLRNGMPSSPVPFITPSGLVTFQHDLKARINSSPLVKVPLTMRPLGKKRSSLPFSLSLKRHSTTIFSRASSASSSASGSPSCTPASEMADPLSMADVDLPSETPLYKTACAPLRQPSIGAKILDRFWPEDEGSYSEESRRSSVPSYYPTALAPPPHHRRAPRSLGSDHDVPFRYVTLLRHLVVWFANGLPSCSDQLPPRTSNEHDTTPLRFPF